MSEWIEVSTVAGPMTVIQVEVDPQDVIPDWGADPDATGTGREAEPPDGKNQDWTEIHPGGSREILEGRL